MRILLLAATLLTGLSVCSQQYIIRYDLAGENVNYLRVHKGDTVKAPVIQLSKSNHVSLQLVNAANSYHRTITLIEKEETPEKIFIPGIGNDAFKNLAADLPGLEAKDFKLNDVFKISQNKDVDFMSDNSQAAEKLFMGRYELFSSAYSNWQQAVKRTQEYQVLWRDLASLRYSMEYAAPVIKNKARATTGTLFPAVGDDASLILQQNENNPGTQLTSLKKSYIDLAVVYSALKNADVKSPVADLMMTDAEKIIQNASSVTVDPGLNGEDVLNRIADLYRLIINDNYTQVVPMEISRRTVMAEIKFTPVIDSVTANAIHLAAKDTITRWVPLYKKEPLRFRNTYGFSFVSYAENRWHYYVRPDSVVARESADQFQPVIVTFLHFYAPRDKGFRWGGTFGAGIPIGGDNTKLNIMMGLSTFLGKNDPVCISIGASGTQVKKLSGMNLGDKINLSELADKNFTSVYRVGYFLSLTFNPSALSMKD